MNYCFGNITISLLFGNKSSAFGNVTKLLQFGSITQDCNQFGKNSHY